MRSEPQRLGARALQRWDGTKRGPANLNPIRPKRLSHGTGRLFRHGCESFAKQTQIPDQNIGPPFVYRQLRARAIKAETRESAGIGRFQISQYSASCGVLKVHELRECVPAKRNVSLYRGAKTTLNP